jgi:hypothetical protein
MDIRLADPIYTDRLASFLESLGQSAIQCGPGQIDVIIPDNDDVAARELEIYLRVWQVLYPDAEVESMTPHQAAHVHAAADTTALAS